MKKLFMLFLFIGILSSCEDVIDVDLNTADPRLVIDASINLLEDGTSDATIRLTTTAPFFNNEVPYVGNASVSISDEDGTIYPFTYTSSGFYTSELTPRDNVQYTITIIYQGETYTATEQLHRVNPLEFVEQKDDGGFTGDEVELKAFFTDPIGEGDFYFFEGFSEKGDHLDIYDDKFFDGNSIFGLYLAEDLTANDEVIFNLYGVDQQFYNFMYVLLQQTSGGGPFETQPATVRGNVINETNPDNFPLGYFRVSEKSTLTYTVQ